MIDPRTPVIVGVGQVSQRPEHPADAREPIDLLALAARAAEADAGGRGLLERADTVAVVDMVSWSYPDPGAVLARRLGIDSSPATLTTTVGGNSPQLLVNVLVPEIARGDRRIVLIGGAECVHTRWRARREPKTWLEWTHAKDPACARVVGDPRPGSSDYEMAHLALAPTQVYPLFETALRAAAGTPIDQHQERVSALWAGFATVAAANEHAWSRVAYTAEAIRTPAPDNRMVAFPYPKRMCANIDVDQAAALLLSSYEVARSAGVPDDRLVYPHGGGDAHDHYFFTERDTLCDSPAIAAIGRALADVTGVGIDDVARFDLYSCFPSAVQIARRALSISDREDGDDRSLTVTGGLGFAGGPGNNYPTHAIAAMVEACRFEPGSIGLVTALGWYVTKHSAGLYSTTPPARGFRLADHAAIQAQVDRGARRTVAGSYDGEATVEATSVVFDREGSPSLAIVAALTSDGRRALANSRDPAVLLSMTETAWEGSRVQLRSDGGPNVVVA